MDSLLRNLGSAWMSDAFAPCGTDCGHLVVYSCGWHSQDILR